MIAGTPYSFGDYKWDEAKNMIVVTELPIGVATDKYVKAVSAGKRGELIEPPGDYSSATKVNLEIKLKGKDAMNQIKAGYGTQDIDAIEDFLMLRKSLKSSLNYIGKNGTVLEFGQSYLALVLYWFPERRDLYARRLERKLTVERLRAVEEAEILRYAEVYETLSVNQLGDAAADALLEEHAFPRLDSALAHSPDFTRTDLLEAAVTGGPGVSYGYLYNLTVRKLTAKSIAALRASLAARRLEVERLKKMLAEKPFAGVSLWRAEIAEIEKVIKRGLETDWKFRAAGPSEKNDGDD